MSSRTLRARPSIKAKIAASDDLKEAIIKTSPKKRKQNKSSKNLSNIHLKEENSNASTDVKQSKLEVPKSNRKSSVSPRKKKGTQESIEIKQEIKNDINDIENCGWEPNNWKEVWENILKMRKLHVAPVDNLGCEECPDKDVPPEVSTIL